MTTSECLACGGALAAPFHVIDAVPVANSMMFASATAATEAGQGRLELRQCTRCGFAQNASFDLSLVDYSAGYEDTQAHSARYLDYANSLIADLVTRHGLEGASTLEIGCGKADFLRLVCAATGGPGIGIDPALAPGAIDDEGLDLTLLDRAYGPDDAALTADLIVCRHTLEHIPDVARFLTMTRHNLASRPDAVLLLEVPDTERILREGAFWDLYYEHCSYFDAASLTDLVARVGFDVIDTRLVYDGQYLVLEARVGTGPARPEIATAPDPTATDAFIHAVERWTTELGGRFAEAAATGRRTALWGAGSKAVGLLTMLQPGAVVPYVVDINPRKTGGHLAGTGHRVAAPEELATDPVDEVIVLNPIYLEEIRSQIAGLGVTPSVDAIS